MANIPLGHGQVARVWVEGDGVPSDVVAGLHANHPDVVAGLHANHPDEGDDVRRGHHPDEGDDVRRGHHSFVVTFRLMREAVQPQPPPVGWPPSLPAPDDERAAIAAGLRRVAGVLEGAAVDLRHLAAAVECRGEAKG